MKKLTTALLLIASTACADKISPEEGAAAYKAVVSLAKGGDMDQDTRRRVFYQLCSEQKGCAQGCERVLSECAKPEVDPSQRATLVASCAADYRGRRDKGEQLHPDVWMKERLVRYLDAVRGGLRPDEQKGLDGARTQLRLLKW